jgi:hypothetical protein
MLHYRKLIVRRVPNTAQTLLCALYQAHSKEGALPRAANLLVNVKIAIPFLFALFLG